jgi:hypothetical protein
MDVDVCDSLAMYPDVTSRLREEILEHVGPSRRPTYADIRDMKFLRAVINGGFSHSLFPETTDCDIIYVETMRLYPSV